MDVRRNFYCNMEVGICTSCISSCCKLEVDITREEYDHLKVKGYRDKMITLTDTFIKYHPSYYEKQDFLDKMYSDMGNSFAILKRLGDGFCVFLNRKSRMCSIYNDRPSICRNYSNKGVECKTIKELIKGDQCIN